MLLPLLLVAAGGCATTTVKAISYASSCSGDYLQCAVADKRNRGFPAFAPKSYRQFLVVTKVKESSTATWVTLPEYPKRPNVFVKHRAGFGSHKSQFSLPKGIITSVSAESDSKIPETLATVASLATSAGAAATGAGALKTGAAALIAAREGALQSASVLKDVMKAVQAVNALLDRHSTDDSLKAEVAAARPFVEEAAGLLDRDAFGDVLGSLDNIRASLKKASNAFAQKCPDKAVPIDTADACVLRRSIGAVVSELDKALRSTLPDTPPNVRIYAVDPATGSFELLRLP